MIELIGAVIVLLCVVIDNVQAVRSARTAFGKGEFQGDIGNRSEILKYVFKISLSDEEQARGIKEGFAELAVLIFGCWLLTGMSSLLVALLWGVLVAVPAAVNSAHWAHQTFVYLEVMKEVKE